MIRMLTVTAMLLVATISCPAAQAASQSKLDPAQAEVSRKFPQIVIYSVAWCPHCREAKEYFTRNNIPFTNKDVEIDEAAMTELTVRLASSGVPVIVIGSGKDEVVMKGFTPELFQESLKKAQPKK